MGNLPTDAGRPNRPRGRPQATCTPGVSRLGIRRLESERKDLERSICAKMDVQVSILSPGTWCVYTERGRFAPLTNLHSAEQVLLALAVLGGWSSNLQGRKALS